MRKQSFEKTLEEFPEFDNYFEFIKNLGSGTFGKVVLAKDKTTGTEVAVKVFIQEQFFICFQMIAKIGLENKFK